ncbi:MAG: DUF2911 domain-containing protein [Ignavibacteriaceae bacterium]|nr:DUF2911 domain-containing protein [Ignavibacteriaceae bacterium]
MNIKIFPVFTFIIALFISVHSQPLTPRVSPMAKITQTIGITDITVSYSRPAVKGRVIWGELVPYDKIWRVGANENSTINFPEPVSFSGAANPLPAGTYGLHMIPGKDQWTIVLSKDNQLWGDYNYKQENDALRFSVKPETCEMTERLTLDFEEITDNSAAIVMKWEKVKIKIPFSMDMKKIVMDNIKKKFSPATANAAASYMLTNNFDLEEGLKWINYSVMMGENYGNLKIKAQLLAKTGNTKEAVAVMEKALEFGGKLKEKPFDYAVMEKLLSEWKAK